MAEVNEEKSFFYQEKFYRRPTNHFDVIKYCVRSFQCLFKFFNLPHTKKQLILRYAHRKKDVRGADNDEILNLEM